MIPVALHRTLSWVIACSDVRQWEQGDTSHGWQDKSPAFRRGHVVGWIECFAHSTKGTCWRCRQNVQWSQSLKRRRQYFRGRRTP
jgi:hypothetical protein